jgi:hypothetical protein
MFLLIARRNIRAIGSTTFLAAGGLYSRRLLPYGRLLLPARITQCMPAGFDKIALDPRTQEIEPSAIPIGNPRVRAGPRCRLVDTTHIIRH